MKKIIYTFLFFTLCNISNAQLFTLQGDVAVVNSNTYRLTQDLNTRAGLITSLYPLNLTENFELNFEIYLGNRFGDGADGITFMLNKACTPTLTIGQNIGVGGTPNSLITEFDTHFNFISNFDIIEHHITIFKNGLMNQTNQVMDVATLPVCAKTDCSVIDDNTWHTVKIKWDFLSSTSQRMSVFFDNSLRVTSTRNHIADSFSNDPNVFYSFGSATGGKRNLHQVRINEDSVIYNVCSGEQVTLLAPSLGSNYSWTAGSSTTNSNTFTPTNSGTVTCNYTDFCGVPKSINFTVTLFPSIVLPVLNAVTPICIGQDSSFTIAGNQGLVLEFNINNGATQTQTIPAFGSITIPLTNLSTNQTLTITKVSNVSCLVDNLSINQTITVNPIPVTSTPVQTN
jgi:hypothetical protein